MQRCNGNFRDMTYNLKCNVSFHYVLSLLSNLFSHQSVRFTSDITMVKLEELDLMYLQYGGDMDMDKDDTDWDTELDLTYPDLI